METKKIVMGVISVAVAIIVLMSMIPIFTDAGASEDTFTNEGAFYVEVNPTDTYTIKYDRATESGVVYVNDEALDVAFSTGFTIFAIDNAILRLQSSDSTLQYKGDGSYLTGLIYIELTVSNGSVTGKYQVGANPGVDVTWPTTTYTTAFVASPETQDYVMTNYNSVAKMNGDSEIIAFGQTYINTSGVQTWALINITGTIDDGVTVDVLDSTTGVAMEGVTISNLSINTDPVSGYIDLYDLTSITFTITYDGATTNVSYSAYVIPTEVTAERSAHASPVEATLIGLIPLLMMVGIMLTAVGLFIAKYRKN